MKYFVICEVVACLFKCGSVVMNKKKLKADVMVQRC